MEDEENKDGAGDDNTTANGDQDIQPAETSAPENTSDDTTDQSEKDTDLSEKDTDLSEKDTDLSEKDTGETDQSEPTSATNESPPAKDDDEPKPDSVSGSPRVQFGAGTKERDGSKKGVQRLKRSFKDIVLTEVMKADPQASPLSPAGGSRGPPPKGILKVRSEPILDSEKSYINKGYREDSEDLSHASRHAAGTMAATSKSAFPFLKRAAGSGNGEGRGFADVVDLLIQRSSLDFGGRDVHPFGRDCSIEGIMQASRPKSHSKNSAFSKLVIWFTLMSFLLGAAFGVIFLSENYNSKQRADRLLKATSLNSSTT